MWFPPYPAHSIARSALPDAPVRVDPDRNDPVRRPGASPIRVRRWIVGPGWRRPARPRSA